MIRNATKNALNQAKGFIKHMSTAIELDNQFRDHEKIMLKADPRAVIDRTDFEKKIMQQFIEAGDNFVQISWMREHEDLDIFSRFAGLCDGYNFSDIKKIGVHKFNTQYNVVVKATMKDESNLYFNMIFENVDSASPVKYKKNDKGDFRINPNSFRRNA